mmetsp:Transcript_85974/g.161926  ORF Transcript_85974/g.161926 Transcript_85974/m.161926 type:complete len:100 (-) Transcript_85974:176-475(-)
MMKMKKERTTSTMPKSKKWWIACCENDLDWMGIRSRMLTCKFSNFQRSLPLMTKKATHTPNGAVTQGLSSSMTECEGNAIYGAYGKGRRFVCDLPVPLV